LGLRPALQDTYAAQVGIWGVSVLNRCQGENCVSFKPPLTAFLQNLKGERFVAVTDNEYRELREILLAEQK
jgi:hypothetical protein